LLTVQTEATPEEIDAAIVQCHRVFAARGGRLRLQQERDQLANQRTAQETGGPKKDENQAATSQPAPDDLKCL
jgi:hypothetical protein